MLRKLFYILLTTVISSATSSYEIEIKPNWQLLGAVKDIHISTFDNFDIESVWIYSNSEWKHYGIRGKNSSFETISSISKGQGFWVNSVEAWTLPVLALEDINVSLKETNSSLLMSAEQYSSKSHQKQFEVIRHFEAERFNELYAPLAIDIPSIDFEKESILALLAGNQSNGYSFVVTGLQRFKNYMVVDINTTIDNPNCSLGGSQVSPFSFIRLSNDKLPIDNIMFNETLILRKCDTSEDMPLLNEPKKIVYKNADDVTIRSGLNKRLEVIQEVDGTVIVLYMGVRYLGDNIKINDILEYNTHIEVNIENSIRKGGCTFPTMIETPSVIVKIPKTNKPIIFKEVIIEKFCSE